MALWLWILLGVLILGVIPTFALSAVIYTVLLVRTSPKKWGRECSLPDDEEYRRMFDIGMEWEKKYAAYKRAAEIESDGFRLAGEYFDFGGTRAVIIIPGRMESLLYSYFFAEPYRTAGYNVLVIDNRAHGLSEGRVSSLGFKEYRDVLAWGRFLHDECGCEAVVLHGICIGSSCALFALTAPDCPPYMIAMAAEGMYTTFHESFKNHMRDGHHPEFPFTAEVMCYIRLISGANVVTDGPVKRIGRLRKPILFLHSREDVFSLPEKAQELYDSCSAPKTLVWFPKGAHSRIRINAPEAYDAAVTDFLASL